MPDDCPSFSSNDVIAGAAQGRLRTIVERIERLDEDKAVVMNDIKEVYAEAKGEGFDVKILRKVVRIRKQDAAKRSEEEALIDLYMSAIEGVATPLIETTASRKPKPAATPVERPSIDEAISQAIEDELYPQAVALVRNDRKASTSYIQRKLQLGYNRAASLMERMQAEGVIGPADTFGKRDILMGPI